MAYVIAIKRTSVCFGVIWGHLIFHEKGVKERLTGAIVMVLGVVLIILSWKSMVLIRDFIITSYNQIFFMHFFQK